ncbi:MAG: amidohydrolase family protein [Beutenbergiaceae bacterium]
MSVESSGRTGAAGAIDVHAHLLPRPLADRANRARIGERTTSAAPDSLIDLETRLRAMDAMGVERQVVSPWIELAPGGLEPRAGSAHLRRVNDALAQEVARAPDRLVGMAMVPQDDGEAAAVELDRSVTDLGMCGALLTTSGVGMSLASAALAPLWEQAEMRRALLLIHPYRSAESTRCQAEGIENLVGTPSEGTLAIAGLLRAGVLDRFPDLRLCAVHGGGALPILLERIEALWDLSADTGGARPTELIGKLYFDTLTHGERALRWLIETVGAERLMLGSDSPFATGDSDPRAPVARLTTLSAADRARILSGTAASLLAQVDRTSVRG